MKNKPLIIISGEPYGVFIEIFLKTIKKKKLKKPLILICSKKLFEKQMKRLNYKFKINEVKIDDINKLKNNSKIINILNVDFNFKKTFDKISNKSKDYIDNCCNIALKIIKKYQLKILINGPISKTHFLDKKFPGMTEYFASKIKAKKDEVMLIYNKNLSVSPLTTHLPLNKIFKSIKKNKIINHAKKIHEFYRINFNKRPKIAITGLNPHCETINKFSEEKSIIKPAINKLKTKKINVFGPFPSDTLFLKKNYKKYDVIIGMYHDQVLTPIKTLYEFKAINITLGLPFLRISPDHGPNNLMLGKNLSDPSSLIEIFNFVNNLREN